MPPKAEATSIKIGRDGVALGGVSGRGTYEEDGPVTWETLVFPVKLRQCGRPVTNFP